MGWFASKSKPEDAFTPVPGTVHLVDLEGVMNAKHAKGAKTRDVVLVPTPSSDPDDPLNWTPRRKLLSTTCMCVYTLMVGIASAAIYSVLEPISEATSLTLGDLNAGTGYMFLAFGWGCLFWQPLALQYGKRPVYLFSILATMAIQVWAPYTKNNGQWIANKILQGFVGAPIESLCEISVTDMYVLHHSIDNVYSERILTLIQLLPTRARCLHRLVRLASCWQQFLRANNRWLHR